jgi:hypothetical protein
MENRVLCGKSAQHYAGNPNNIMRETRMYKYILKTYLKNIKRKRVKHISFVLFSTMGVEYSD